MRSPVIFICLTLIPVFYSSCKLRQQASTHVFGAAAHQIDIGFGMEDIDLPMHRNLALPHLALMIKKSHDGTSRPYSEAAACEVSSQYFRPISEGMLVGESTLIERDGTFESQKHEPWFTKDGDHGYDFLERIRRHGAWTHCDIKMAEEQPTRLNSSLARVDSYAEALKNKVKQQGLTLELVVILGEEFRTGAVRPVFPFIERHGVKVRNVELDTANAASDEALQRIETAVFGKQPKGTLSIVWAPGLAGLVALDMLARSQDARNSTMALITVASPLGGSTTPLLLRKIDQEVVKKLASPLTQALFNQTDLKDLVSYLRLFESSRLEPASRRDHLIRQIASADFHTERTEVYRQVWGQNFPVYHIAGYADPYDWDLANIAHASAAIHVPARAYFPVSDGIVALQHAVLPKQVRPKGSEIDVLAVTSLSHFENLSMSVNQGGFSIPMGDALIEAFARHMLTKRRN